MTASTRALTQPWADALVEAPLQAGDRVLVSGLGQESARLADLAATCGFDVVHCDPAPGALTHLLWWDPAIRAVLVLGGPGTECDEAGRALELTGSDALLLVVPLDDLSPAASRTALGRTALPEQASLVTHQERLGERVRRGLGTLAPRRRAAG
jgi:hypothetical protein